MALNKKGRSASQVLQDDSTLTSVKIWANAFKNVGRSRKISDWTEEQNVTQKLRPNNKWQSWKRFFIKIRQNDNNNDVMSKEESRENEKCIRHRKNAAVFVPDYEEEQTVNNDKRDSLEICDLEDSGTFDMSNDN